MFLFGAYLAKLHTNYHILLSPFNKLHIFVYLYCLHAFTMRRKWGKVVTRIPWFFYYVIVHYNFLCNVSLWHDWFFFLWLEPCTSAQSTIPQLGFIYRVLLIIIFLYCNLYCVCWMNTVAWCYLPGNMIKSPIGSLWLLLPVIRFVLWHPAIVLTRSWMPHRSATAPGSNGSAYVLLQASCVQYSWVPLCLMWKKQLWWKSFFKDS